MARSSPAKAATDTGEIRGATASPRGILTWGESFALWPWDGSEPHILERGRNYGRAGCFAAGHLFLLEDGRRLIRHQPRLVIEDDTQTSDLLWTRLHGEDGLLYIHLDAQLRFWTPRGVEEIYSIYTPSRQGGLITVDLDGDSRAELLCGNYWLRDSGRRGAAWRLFALNTYFAGEDSALARLCWVDRPRGLLWASRERLVFHRPPPRLEELWPATPIEVPGLGEPHAWLSSSNPLLAHSRGVHAFRWDGAHWQARELTSGGPWVALLSRGGVVWAVNQSHPVCLAP
jgi:hypothetical protein